MLWWLHFISRRSLRHFESIHCWACSWFIFLLSLSLFRFIPSLWYIFNFVGGLAITYALSITQTLSWWTKQISEREMAFVSVERFCDFIHCPQEAPFVRSNHASGSERSTVVPARSLSSDWPRDGVIRFENVSMRYRPELELALSDLSFSTTKQEKLGIVGRTGAWDAIFFPLLFPALSLTYSPCR